MIPGPQILPYGATHWDRRRIDREIHTDYKRKIYLSYRSKQRGQYEEGSQERSLTSKALRGSPLNSCLMISVPLENPRLSGFLCCCNMNLLQIRTFVLPVNCDSTIQLVLLVIEDITHCQPCYRSHPSHKSFVWISPAAGEIFPSNKFQVAKQVSTEAIYINSSSDLEILHFKSWDGGA